MLPLSPKSREERSVRKPKRSRAGASHPRPNLRAPHLSSCPALHPYESHSPSHRVPSSTTLAHFCSLLSHRAISSTTTGKSSSPRNTELPNLTTVSPFRNMSPPFADKSVNVHRGISSRA